MTTVAATASTSTSARPGAVVPLLIVLFAVGQIAASVISGLWAPEPLASGAEVSPLVPPGAWFSIWSFIILLSIAWSIVAFRRSVRTERVRMRMAPGLLVAVVGFSVWLSIAAFGQSQPLTVPVLAIIVLGLAWSARVLVVERDRVATWPVWERLLAWATVGVYLGWTSMATFLNIATVAQAAGAPADGVTGTVWQVALLALAAGAAVSLVLLTRGAAGYALTASYALVGVALSAGTQGYPLLAAVAVGAVVAVIGSAAVLKVRSRSTAPARG